MAASREACQGGEYVKAQNLWAFGVRPVASSMHIRGAVGLPGTDPKSVPVK